MKQSELIADLRARTKHLVSEAEGFKRLSVEQLNAKPSPTSWSILECLEHLNLYGDFYLPEIEGRILSSQKIKGDPSFKSGWFGEKTVQDMLPKNGAVKKMNTFKNKNPINSNLSIATIDRFIKQQEGMLRLLDLSSSVHLEKVKTKITLPLIKFKLGTTFRFVIYHNQRHIWQAKNILA
jgi:hypothetical protein